MAATAIKLILPPALGAYTFVHEPRPPPPPSTGEPKFSTALLWPASKPVKVLDVVTKQEITLEQAVVKVAAEKWGDKAAAMLKAGKLKNPIRSGDTDRSESPEFEGMVFITASSTKRPGIVNAQNKNLKALAEEAALNGEEFDPREECYSGCILRASVSLFCFDKGVNKGVGVGLNNLQVIKKGERIDGRKKAEDEFEDFKADDVDDLV
jgi:hypothetical protein